MTKDEMKAAICSLQDSLSKKFEEVDKRLGQTEGKIEQKNLPINLEQDILRTTQVAINKSMHDVLSSFQSPLGKLISLVIDSHTVELRKIIDDAFCSVIQKEDFKESIRQAFSHKVAKSIISNNDGLFDKVNNELKEDR
jgi:hypothetical protein